MWAQLITARARPDADLTRLHKLIRDAEEPGTGLVRTIVARDQNDPARIYTLVLFDTEDHARARESDPQRQQRLQPARDLMAETFDGQRQFVDLDVLDEWTG
jgi:hypothetical protein